MGCGKGMGGEGALGDYVGAGSRHCMALQIAEDVGWLGLVGWLTHFLPVTGIERMYGSSITSYVRSMPSVHDPFGAANFDWQGE